MAKKDNDIKARQNKFLSRNICKNCKKPMSYLGGNIMCCQNPNCKGIKVTKTNRDGEEYVTYEPSFRLLNGVAESVAEKLFD